MSATATPARTIQTGRTGRAGRTYRTGRSDYWWVQPVVVGIGLASFVIYSTWAAFQNEHFVFTGSGAHYLSPFYSPDLIAFFGKDLFPSWLPSWIPHSPSFLILWAPAGFRMTCYYYRKSYYRAYVSNPAACGVRIHERSYKGETSFPLILQNLHRYFFYLALIVLVILAYDAVISYKFVDGFGIGVGSIVLTANVLFLSGYTLGCHSLRHLIGGKLDCFSCSAPARVQHGMWSGVSILNKNHQFWAWLSLFVVGFSDIYVRLCSMGIWTDWRIL